MVEYKTEDITVGDVAVTIETSGPENEAEKVHMHSHDAAVRAMQAFDTGKHPDECEGLMMKVAWERVLE